MLDVALGHRPWSRPEKGERQDFLGLMLGAMLGKRSLRHTDLQLRPGTLPKVSPEGPGCESDSFSGRWRGEGKKGPWGGCH